jgi:hypothetical protein
MTEGDRNTTTQGGKCNVAVTDGNENHTAQHGGRNAALTKGSGNKTTQNDIADVPQIKENKKLCCCITM